MTIALAVLLGTVALAAYAYLLYPGLLWLWGRVAPRPAGWRAPAVWPLVSITVPAYNEERTIAATLDALLAIDYPADRRQILVVSDASSDRTDAIVRTYADRGVELLRQERRAGKTAAENAALAHLRGEIVINTDASVRIRPDALRPLVLRFTDPTVGVASGRDVSVARIEDTGNIGESGYVGYEMWVRRLETEVGGIIGASGCFYGIRKDLHLHLVPEALSRDFSAPLTAREHGYRAVSVDEAICYVPRVSRLRQEYRRKVRTITRGIETLFYRRALMNPLRHGRFAWMLFSHKVCRWLVPWAAVVGVAALAVLAGGAAWPRVLLVLGGAHAAVAIVAWWLPEGRRLPRLLALAAFTFWGNFSVLHASIMALRGELSPTWEPTRRADVLPR